MELAGRQIGFDYSPLIIADIGINHGGCLKTAMKMVKLASEAGCECIKHQTHIIEDEMTDEAKSIFPPNANISIWDVMKQNSLSLEDEKKLKEYTESLDMIWISTPFSRAAVDFLDDLKVPAFKIGSGECDNLPLIKHISKKGRPVIMSTGMQSIESIKKSVKILQDYEIEFALLECTNLYPSPPENVSLKGISELKQAFPKSLIGFSDHSIGPEMALASISMGATIIERHFTDTRYRIGPDISCSMDPAELRFLIDRSKEIHRALLNPKSRTSEEEDVYRFARASVVADKEILPGSIIKEEDIWARRPGTGEIPGYELESLVGKKVKNKLLFNQQIKWSDIENN